ncbi:neutral zinc metallopeptidase [Thermobifida fusca]|uniref:neutral zinc metallopeptidase n=1 Tax=Thermobifida fusca TaxID=2021 RepID=UPI0011AFFE79|nr:neutral zinc metallopeptidase [Thermobifida fusca]
MWASPLSTPDDEGPPVETPRGGAAAPDPTPQASSQDDTPIPPSVTQHSSPVPPLPGTGAAEPRADASPLPASWTPAGPPPSSFRPLPPNPPEASPPSPQYRQELTAAHVTPQFSAPAAFDGAFGAWEQHPPLAPPPRQGDVRLWLAAMGTAFVAALCLVLCAVMTAATLRGGTVHASGKPHRDVRYADSWFHTAGAIPVDVADHPFYALPAPGAVACEIPEFNAATVAGWEEFTEVIGPCLNAMWLSPLEELGLRPQEPHYVILDEIPAELRDESEEEGVTLAYYLEHELSITILVPNVRKLLRYPGMDDKRIWFALVAHEYGHHLQGETGLLDAAYTLQLDAKSTRQELQLGRQIELQAECLAGTGVAAIAGHDHADVAFVNRNFNEGTGDSDTHGSADNRVHWFNAGATAETMAACNTFAAEDRLVR